ncbi:MAG: element excision factor XisH family protein [Caldilineaceae bacterium]
MAKDIIHDAVRNALVKDGWRIIREHFKIEYEEIEIFADLIVDRSPIIAVKDSNKLIIEIKSFAGRSFVRELQQAIGQYELYVDMIEFAQLDYELFLAVSKFVHETFLQRTAARQIIQRHKLKLVVVDTDHEEIVEWIR